MSELYGPKRSQIRRMQKAFTKRARTDQKVEDKRRLAMYPILIKAMESIQMVADNRGPDQDSAEHKRSVCLTIAQNAILADVKRKRI